MNINLHYLNRYNKLINYYKTQYNQSSGYYEKHHIIPKCLGGKDDIDKMVLIPARVHFIIHWLLSKSYPNNRQLMHAFAMMGVNNQHQNRECSSKLYEMSKQARSKSLTGVSRPEWVKQKLRKPKSNTENYKKPKSAEHSKNISLALKGKSKTKEHAEKCANTLRLYQENRKKLTKEKMEYYRLLYISSGLSRIQFAEINGISHHTMKRYLKGL